jgi:restriction system protein
MNKEDKRFIEPKNIADRIEGENLALMHWEEFEQLIREIFEKEFSQNGGEVKITQASRDGGVDAIAFDPDPIRGGKIIIQAKRYTNVVGVSAVRDLYGAVTNERANKGILVTTSNYGSDARHFAKDKPLTLLNGANLLHLMEKHGYSGRIDLNEAKIQLKK